MKVKILSWNVKKNRGFRVDGVDPATLFINEWIGEQKEGEYFIVLLSEAQDEYFKALSIHSWIRQSVRVVKSVGSRTQLVYVTNIPDQLIGQQEYPLLKEVKRSETDIKRSFAKRLLPLSLSVDKNVKILIILVHLHSKIELAQNEMNQHIFEHIKQIESLYYTHGETRYTTLVGDFNYNPFDMPIAYQHHKDELVNQVYQNYLLCTGNRHFLEDHRETYFYNPTWGLLGDWQRNDDNIHANYTFYFGRKLTNDTLHYLPLYILIYWIKCYAGMGC